MRDSKERFEPCFVNEKSAGLKEGNDDAAQKCGIDLPGTWLEWPIEEAMKNAR